MQRFGQAGGGFARGGAQGGARCGFAVQQGKQFGNRGGFARARPAADEDKVLQQRKRGGGLLVAAAFIGKPVCQQLCRRVFGLHDGRGRQTQNLARQIPLLLPVFRQHQPPPLQHQRALRAVSRNRRGLCQPLRLFVPQINGGVAACQGGKQAFHKRRSNGGGFGCRFGKQAQRGGSGKTIGRFGIIFEHGFRQPERKNTAF